MVYDSHKTMKSIQNKENERMQEFKTKKIIDSEQYSTLESNVRGRVFSWESNGILYNGLQGPRQAALMQWYSEQMARLKHKILL